MLRLQALESKPDMPESAPPHETLVIPDEVQEEIAQLRDLQYSFDVRLLGLEQIFKQHFYQLQASISSLTSSVQGSG